jgi:hypothetical protein
MIGYTIEGDKVRALRVLLVILLSAPLLTMTAGAYMIAGQDLSLSDVPGMMTPMGLGTLSGTGSGIPASIGFSMPDLAFLEMPSAGRTDGSSFTMPDTSISNLMGQTGISTIQGCLDNVGSLTSGIVDVNNLVKLPW